MQLYNWNAVKTEALSAHLSRKVIHTESMTLARLELKKGCTVPEHSHLNEQVSTVETGALLFYIGGGEQTVRAGESLVIPAHVPHRVDALEDTTVVDVFSPARADWIRGDDAYLRR